MIEESDNLPVSSGVRAQRPLTAVGRVVLVASIAAPRAFAVFVLPFLLGYPLRKPIIVVTFFVLGSGALLILIAPAALLTLWVVGEALQRVFGRSGP